MIRAFLIDDEALALRRLRRLLEETGRVEIVGEATDPVTALDGVEWPRIDVLFLDIQMPGLNGFELLERLGADTPPIIFTTAWHEYALKAFEVNSIDYLLKPVEPRQLDRALGKLERVRRGAEPRPDTDEIFRQLASVLEGRRTVYPTRIPSRTGDRVEFVDLQQVTHFYAADKLTFASTNMKDYVVDGSIVDLEARLDPSRFVRIHRATLVNIEYVQELYTWFGGKVLIRLHGDRKTELTVARDRVRSLKDRLNL